MTRTAKLISKVKRGVQTMAYGNPLYQKILAAGDTPQRLPFTPADPWPGDAQAGLALLSGQGAMFDAVEHVAMRHAGRALRNLRAVGTDAARAASVELIDGWLRHFDTWDDREWQPDYLGARIAAWIGFHDFYISAAPTGFAPRLVSSLHRQWKHLLRAVSPDLTGVAAMQAIRGLIYGGFNFPEGDKALGFACDLLQRQIAAEILPDGGHISRNPSAHLHMLRHLVDIRTVFQLADIRLPESIGLGLAAMIPALKFYRHGDGGLPLFHGAVEETPLLIDAVLTQATMRGRALRRLTETGYERLVAGRSLALVDTAAPPPRAFGADAHAGLLSFEFSHGKERIIVNCGAAPHGAVAWRAACAATAAHSTVTVADTNACDIDSDGAVIGSAQVLAQRFEEGGDLGLELSHDGYRNRYHLIHHRLLRLSGDGDILQGRDVLQGREGRAFTLRWHVHPAVQVSLSQGGHTALLRTASGSGWRLRSDDAILSLEASIYCGASAPPVPRRTLQLTASSITQAGDTAIGWSLTRERKS